MEVEILKQSDYIRMPWKNGLGETEQLHIYPTNSHFPSEAFIWRLSSAKIQDSNTFSLFPGCDRILVVLKGRGLKLNGCIELAPLVPYEFPGETPMNCELIDSEEVIDLGLIFRRNVVKATMMLESFENKTSHILNSSEHQISLRSGTHYLFLLSGSLRLKETKVYSGDTIYVNIENEKMNLDLGVEEIVECLHIHIQKIY